jgi:hypothetical protein
MEKQLLSARGFKRAGRHSGCSRVLHMHGVEVRKKRSRGFK